MPMPSKDTVVIYTNDKKTDEKGKLCLICGSMVHITRVSTITKVLHVLSTMK